MTLTLKKDFLNINSKRLEIARYDPKGAANTTLVFLHEGLGCTAMWRDFPARVAAVTGCRAFVYSRFGYGQSDPCSLPRPTNLPQGLIHVDGHFYLFVVWLTCQA